MVATHNFLMLVFSGRPFMKKASWGCCVLVFDSSREPAVHPGCSDSCAPGCSGTEFEVGCTTSCEDGVGATVSAPMDFESSMNWFKFCIRRDLVGFHLCYLSSPVEVPVADFGEGDNSPEAETKREREREREEIAKC